MSEDNNKDNEKLYKVLLDLTDSPEEIFFWLKTPNKAFENLTPQQIIDRGDSDRIWQMIYELRDGNAG